MVLAPRSASLPKLSLKPGRWTVGSASTCSYRIAGDGVQPRHALILCGVQTIVLKAWDPRTWRNGQPVIGEVRLHPGDRITLGTVELFIEMQDDPAAMLPASSQSSPQEFTNTPNEPSPISSSPARALVSEDSETPPEGWDLERLREQIQELRDELSQRVLRRGGTETSESTTPNPPGSEAEQASARVAELEQSIVEAQRVAEHAQQELAAALTEYTHRETELRQTAESLRPSLEASQQNIAELTRELNQLRSETAQRELIQKQQEAAWNAEREQWHQELAALKTSRQQSESDWEQRQSSTLDDATRWKAECEQLRTAWQLQQAAWENERLQLRNDTQSSDETQQALATVTLREQELAEQSQRLLAEQQQLQAEQLERDQATAALAEERQHVEQHAADVLAKFEDLSRRVSEFEQQQANFHREHQTLEHSWNWLQSDRRKLVEEKEDWQQQRALWQAEHEHWIEAGEQLQRDQEELAKARESWQAEHVAAQQLTAEIEQLLAQRQQLQAEHQSAVKELEAARAELQSQQQAIRDEQERLDALRPELEARADKLSLEQPPTASDRPLATNEPADHGEDPSWTSTPRLDIEGNWTTRPTGPSPDSSSSMTTLADPWSVGVDLTAPRETYTSHLGVESGSLSKPTSLREDSLTDELPSTAEHARRDAASAEQSDDLWDAVTTSQTADERDLSHSESIESSQQDSLTADNATESQSISEPDAAHELTQSAPDNAETTVESPGQVFSILESLAFDEDEDVDESVSRYMQHLLSRSTEPKEGKRDRYIPISAVKRSAAAADAAVKPPSEVSQADDLVSQADPSADEIQEDVAEVTPETPLPTAEAPSLRPPLQLQDRAAIRAATEQMRQVANQQTVKVVEAANRKQIRQSVKSKAALAALSFVLSAGLLYWGYQGRSEFLILGFCTSGLGIVTWLDLLFAIRQGRVRTSQLTGRKKPAGTQKP